MKEPTRFNKFLGGRNLIFLLSILILIVITIFIYTKISFIFYPLIVILSTVAPPAIIAFIIFYLMNPIVNLLEKIRIKRLWGIIIIILSIGGIITGLVFLVLPSIQKQANDLIVDIPKYVEQIGVDIQNITDYSFLESTYNKGYEWVQSTISDVPNAIKNYTGDLYDGFVNVATTVTNVFVALFTFPFVLFFLLKDGDAFKRFFIRILPPKFRSDANQILYNKGYEWVQSTISDVPNAIKNYTGDLYDGFVNVATTVTNVFVALFTFPFVLFFLLKDGDAFKRFFIRILPPKFRSDANQILHN